MFGRRNRELSLAFHLFVLTFAVSAMLVAGTSVLAQEPAKVAGDTVDAAGSVGVAPSDTPAQQTGEDAPKGCCGRCRRAGAGMGHGHGNGQGAGRGPGPRAGAGHGMGGPGRMGGQGGMGCCGMMGADDGHHETIHSLLGEHEKISREVEAVEGGIASRTTSDDPQVTDWIRQHVAQMSERLENGQGLRFWDPLFAEMFEHHDAVQLEYEEVPGGVAVRETSDDEQVRRLIESHAQAVSEFVEQGFARAHQPTPLPAEFECPLLVKDSEDDEDAEDDEDDESEVESAEQAPQPAATDPAD